MVAAYREATEAGMRSIGLEPGGALDVPLNDEEMGELRRTMEEQGKRMLSADPDSL